MRKIGIAQLSDGGGNIIIVPLTGSKASSMTNKPSSLQMAMKSSSAGLWAVRTALTPISFIMDSWR